MRNSCQISFMVCVFVFLPCRGIAGAGDNSWERTRAEVEQLKHEGKYTQAETVLLGMLREAQAAPSDELTAVILYELGSIYRYLGRSVEAERLLLRSLSAWEKSVPANDPSLFRPLSSLVALYLENGQYRKAEQLQRRSIEVARVFRFNDPELARLIHNLAALYHRQRKYKEAEALYRDALASLQKTFGPEDGETALVMNNLALLYAKTGRQREAATCLERALQIWEQTLGPDHPDMARVLSNLGGLYHLTGRHAEAEPLFKRALAIAEKTVGPENLLVAMILQEYAVLLRKSKRKDQAGALEIRAQAIRQSYAHEDLSRHTVDAGDLRPQQDKRQGKDR